MAQNNLILDKSYTFALDIIQLYKLLCSQNEYVLSKQLLRSGTSIGANCEEAAAAQSKNDFIAKMSISLKEARESRYWIRLLIDSHYIDSNHILLSKSEEIIRILSSIVKSSKENNAK